MTRMVGRLVKRKGQQNFYLICFLVGMIEKSMIEYEGIFFPS